MNAVSATYLICCLLYAVLAALLAVHWRGRLAGLLLLFACTITGAWALAAAIESGFGWSLGGIPGAARGALETLASGGWLVFLGSVYRAGLVEDAARRRVERLVLGAGFLCVALVALELSPVAAGSSGYGVLLFADLVGHLLLAVAGLALATTFFQQAAPENREQVKYLCVAIGAWFAFELFVYSEALLVGRLDALLASSRGVVNALIAPLIAVAAARNPSWSVELYVSRRAVFHSAVLLGVGIYMLGLAAVGTLLRAVGSEWGPLLQVAFLFGAGLLLVVLLSSESPRSLLKLQIRRHFFRAKYDYREEWLRFVNSLSSTAEGGDLRERALRAVAQIVESPGGGLWLSDGSCFSAQARVDFQEAETALTNERGCEELRRLPESPLELDRKAREETWLVDWVGRCSRAWLILPLIHRGATIGFIVLLRPLIRRTLSQEDRELLRIVARQAASYLAEEDATRALDDAKHFHEFSQRVAFLAHDLRNVAHELGLALGNARKHINNPEFQRDLLVLMESSIAGLERLLDEFRGDARTEGVHGLSDLSEVVASALEARCSQVPAVHLDIGTAETLRVEARRDQLSAVTGHLIRNAREAAGAEGHVEVRLRRHGSEGIFEVADDGPGMTDHFVREHLNHPFASRSGTGYGLGLYQCNRIARELGGRLEIHSQKGAGTVARLRLPLVEGIGVPTPEGSKNARSR